jgi:hypothetical protein
MEDDPYHFNKLLDTKFKELGFIQSRADPCRTPESLTKPRINSSTW